MSVSTGWIELNNGLKSLRHNWEDAKTDWNDSVRRDFEEDLWIPLEQQVLATLRAIDRLAPVLARAQQDCS
jgi:hypothetical protein